MLAKSNLSLCRLCHLVYRVFIILDNYLLELAFGLFIVLTQPTQLTAYTKLARSGNKWWWLSDLQLQYECLSHWNNSMAVDNERCIPVYILCKMNVQYGGCVPLFGCFNLLQFLFKTFFIVAGNLTFRHHASCIQDRCFTTLQRTLFIYLINKYTSLSDICLTVRH